MSESELALHRSRWLTAALLVAVATVHLPGLGGDYLYDDRLLVTQNVALQTDDLARLLRQPLFGGVTDYWRPLTMLALWFGDRTAGAAGVHALALLAHLVATWFALRLARRFVVRPEAAFAAALLFGVHPVQVEGVAWCAAINDPLWWAFGLWCLDAVLRSAHAAAAVAFAMALLAKESAVALLPLVAMARWAVRLPVRRSLAWLLGVVAFWWLLRWVAFGSVAGGIGHRADDPIAVARWPAAALEVFGRHLELLVWPWPMSPFRAFDGGIGMQLRAAAWALAWGAAAVIAGRRRDRVALFALAAVAAPLALPTAFAARLGPYPIADRYLGPAVLGAALLLVGRDSGRRRCGFALALGLGAAVASVLQVGIWRDDAHLVECGLAVAPRDPGLLVMDGNGKLAAGAFPAARSAYEAALAAMPSVGAGVRSRIALDAELGLAWCDLNGAPPNPRRARQRFERIAQSDPQSAFAWIGLGVAHGMLGDAGLAERALRHAIELDPASSQAHGNLANLYFLGGRYAEARAAAQRAVELDAGNTRAAELLQRLGGQSTR
ncbi:MAG: tetratricopeptide repeat protein [Planctomycetes bacterium]|nr:tetratricopeptide repeat protein [Planctomycetota bacterium]